MSRSLRSSAFNGLKDYEVASLKKQMKNKHNRDRHGSKIKHDQQSICLTKTEKVQDSYNEEWGFDGALGWS